MNAALLIMGYELAGNRERTSARIKKDGVRTTLKCRD
jgi:hypothetical protein